MIHKLKTWPIYYQAIVDNYKTFEIRKNDRNFQFGDTVVLQEWLPESCKYTGREFQFVIRYLIKGPLWGLPEDLCVMSITG